MKELFHLRFVCTKQLRIILIILTMLQVCGCGGGTSGTGNGENTTLVVNGVLVNESGVPLAGYTVTLLGSGASVETDEQGMFHLPVDEGRGDMVILVEKGDLSSQVILPEIPESETSTFDVTVTVSEQAVSAMPGIPAEVSSGKSLHNRDNF